MSMQLIIRVFLFYSLLTSPEKGKTECLSCIFSDISLHHFFVMFINVFINERRKESKKEKYRLTQKEKVKENSNTIQTW